jgi:hypothetical protein
MSDIKDSYSKQELPRKNLAHGKKIESVLKACKKFDLNDRVCFAENLGRIIKNLISKNQSITIRKIFIEAFDDSAESLYKKRKSLITWPNEESIAENLRSKARDYLSIVRAVAKFESENTSEGVEKIKKKLILVLISGSSFDDNRNTRDRLFEESRSHYKMQINRLVNKVLESCDLDYQFHFAENHFPGLSVNVNKLGLNSDAPQVKIADIYMSQEIDKYALVDIKKGDENDIRTKLLKEVYEKGFKIPYNDEYEDYELDSDLWDIALKTENDGFWGLKTFTEPTYIFYIRSEAIFEIRYDPASFNWCGVINWECNNGWHSDEDFETYDVTNGTLKEDIYLFSWGEDCLKASLFKNNKDTDTYILFWDYEYVAHHRRFENSGGFRGLINYSARALAKLRQSINYGLVNELDEFALSNEEDISFEVIPSEILRDEKASYDSFIKFTPVPSNSLAHIVLHNLAYAPIEKRLDTLLIKDAIEKHAKFKKLEKEIKEEYFSKINNHV